MKSTSLVAGTLLLSSLFSVAGLLSAPALASPTAPVPAAPVPAAAPLALHEDWQWPSPTHDWTVAVLPGVATINSTTGFSLQIAGAYKLLDKGFAPEMNNQVFLEVQAGPFSVSNGSALLFSTHIRWDFVLNGDWTFYGLGGLGGNKTSSSLGGDFQLLPRFGVGAILNIERQTLVPVDLRAELSREFVALGAQMRF
ncbi:MAG: hypothetical protein ACK5QT_06275 [Oligoflexia bacterium]|jgi:hypothetical protein